MRYSKFGRHPKVAFQAEEHEPKIQEIPWRFIKRVNPAHAADPKIRYVIYLLAKIGVDGLWTAFQKAKREKQ